MAISLIVLLIPVALGVLLYRTLYQGDEVVTVDPSEAIASAGRDGLTQLPPSTAPEGWSIISAQFRDGVLRIGYLDPERRGVQLIQSRVIQSQGAPEQPRPGEKFLSGSRDGMNVMLVTRDADLAPLARTLPIPLSPAGA
jgi:hypothetical protein